MITMNGFFLRGAVSVLPALLLPFQMVLAADGTPPRSAYTAAVTIDAAAPGTDKLAPELFGVAWNWTDSGGGLMDGAELIRDRSFRNQGDAATRAWAESPESKTRGRIRVVASGGHDKPRGGKGYAGYAKLSQEGVGYTCVSQQVWDSIEASAQYELLLSARGEGGVAGMSVFFADQQMMPIEKLDKLALVKADVWSDLRFVLKPEKSLLGAFLRICLVSAGELGIDEVRLRKAGGVPAVRAAASARIQELGVRSLRWPTGSDADYFDWRESIGSLPDRGENSTQFGIYQTPSLGLHEFLDFCEAKSIVPLITVNIREPASNAADLVEYVLGSRTTPMGALRTKNGRAEPWDVRHFELGNEPTELYRDEFSRSDTAKGYVKLAKSTSIAMRAKARQIGKPLELKGVLEAGFTVADWISVVPMLAKWNSVVLDSKTGLRPHMEQIKGNFYSAFTWKSSERELFEEVMGGGATLAASVRRFSQDNGPQPPFWLTEYGIMIQKKKFLGGPEIQLDRAKDFQAGLSAADMLMTSIGERFGGAYLFNLSQWGTWGVIGNPQDLRLRPAGLAFSMISPSSGETHLPTRVEGGKTIRLASGEGNNPAKTQYPTIAAIATRSSRSVSVVLLNRSFDTNEKLWVDLRGFPVTQVETQRLGPDAPTANNETKIDAVRIRRLVEDVSGFHIMDLPARSLARLIYSRK